MQNKPVSMCNEMVTKEMRGLILPVSRGFSISLWPGVYTSYRRLFSLRAGTRVVITLQSLYEA